MHFQKSESQTRKSPTDAATVQISAKSWVFEGITEDEYHNTDDSSSVSICSTSPAHVNSSKTNQKSKNHRGRRTSDANSERFNQPMSSFSRCATPSPMSRSGQCSPINGPIHHDYVDPLPVSGGACSTVNGVVAKPKPNRLTVDYVSCPAPPPAVVKITPKLQTAVSLQSNGPSSLSSQHDGSQFASLLAELEHTLMDKKLNKEPSPDASSLTASSDKLGSSKSSSKDLEFSKELEAALQLIQELETPSEGPMDHVPASTKFARSESEKTLSAAVSLPSPEAMPFMMTSPGDGPPTPHNGKHSKRNAIMIESNSQSTSGYSSPNSFSSNAHSSCDKDYSVPTVNVPSKNIEQVFSSDLSNVVRIYIEPGGKSTGNNTTLLTKGHILSASNLLEASRAAKQIDSMSKSFSLFKKRSKLMPQPDFQNRIFKSECLAYLSDAELVAKHRNNREAIRVRYRIHRF